MLQEIFNIKAKVEDLIKVQQFGFQFGPDGGLSQLQIRVSGQIGLEDVQAIADLLNEKVPGEKQISYSLGENSQITLRSAR